VEVKFVFLFAFRYDSGEKCVDGTCVSKAEEIVSRKIPTGISGIVFVLLAEYRQC